MFGSGEWDDDLLDVDYGGMNEGMSGRLGYTLVEDIPAENIPGRGKRGVKKGEGDDKRLIVVGDIHGMFDECLIFPLTPHPSPLTPCPHPPPTFPKLELGVAEHVECSQKSP